MKGIKPNHIIQGVILSLTGVSLIVKGVEMKKASLNVLGTAVIGTGILSVYLLKD